MRVISKKVNPQLVAPFEEFYMQIGSALRRFAWNKIEPHPTAPYVIVANLAAQNGIMKVCNEMAQEIAEAINGSFTKLALTKKAKIPYTKGSGASLMATFVGGAKAEGLAFNVVMTETALGMDKDFMVYTVDLIIEEDKR